ncbi:MAG: two-component regulator propeller domain-containing protein [Fidelibacterota bacterium]
MSGVEIRKDLEFQRLSSEQGLSQNSVNCIAQDSLGFLWIGTQDGLNRYDGYSFTVFRPDMGDSTSIPSNSISALLTDHEGIVWIGTDDGAGLIAFNPQTEKFTDFRRDPDDSTSLGLNYIYSLMEDDSGTLTIGGDLGLVRFNASRTAFSPAPIPLLTNTDKTVVTAIIADYDGSLWLGTYDGVVHIGTDPDSVDIYRHEDDNPASLADNYVESLAWDAHHHLWIGTDSGLDVLDVERGKVRHLEDLFSLSEPELNHAVYSVYPTPVSLMWIGTGAGLFLIHPSTGAIQSIEGDNPHRGGFQDHILYSIFQDRSGVYWFGTGAKGLQSFDPRRRKFQLETNKYRDPTGLINNSIFALMEDDRGLIWVGTERGLDIWDVEQDTHRWVVHNGDDTTGLIDNSITALYEDRQGYIWIGTDKGANRYDPRDGTYQAFQYRKKDTTSLGYNYIFDFTEDSTGHLWLGSYGGGINRFHPESGTFTRYLHQDADSTTIASDWVMSLYTDSQGRIWVGTDGSGISVFNPDTKTFTHYTHDPDDPQTISSNSIYSFYEDSSGYMWIGTHGGGLNRMEMESGRTQCYTTDTGLPNNVIYGILADNFGNLWLSTNKGLARFNPGTGSVTRFDRFDGLQGPEFNQGAFCRRKNGALVFGGIEGINIVNPGNIRLNTQVPTVVFTDFSLQGRAVRPGPGSKLKYAINYQKSIMLEHGENDFTLSFAALNYSIPERNQYAYRLIGYDRDWVKAGTKRQARYMNIDPGAYTFQVIAANSDGIWNKKGRSIKIVIQAPYWQTWWFQLIMVGLIATGIGMSVKRQITKVSRERASLEKRIRKRTKELHKKNKKLREANKKLQKANAYLEKSNEDKILLIDTITHDIKNPLSVITGLADILSQENPDDQMLRAMIRSSDSLTRILDDVVTIAQIALDEPLPREKLDLTQVLRTLCDDFEHALRLANMKLNWEVERGLIVNANIIIRAVFTNYH